ncbi:MAG: phage tail protein [Akkermansiaceae bacterium]
MADPFLAEVSIFAGNFAPRGWAFCEGQLLQIAQNTALFSLLGTIYGGDGRVTFGLPDLKGRTPIGQGTGPGLSNIRMGEKGGVPTYTISAQNLPNHVHALGPMHLPVSTDLADSQDVEDGYLAETEHNHYHSETNSSILINTPTDTGSTGHETPATINTYQPSLAVNYIIATVGTYPSRS